MNHPTNDHVLHTSVMAGLLSLLLSVSLFFCSFVNVCADWYEDNENDHGCVSYAELQYTGFDETNLLTALQNMETLCEKPGNDSAMLENYRIMTQEFDKLLTQRSINNLRYYNDVNNTEYQSVDTELSLLVTDLADKAGHALHLVLTSDYFQLISDAIGSPEIADYYLDYIDMTQEQKDLTADSKDLVQQYDRGQSKDYTYTDADGKVWTQDSMTTDPDIYKIPGKYEEVSEGLAKVKNEALASIFISLMKNHNRQAQLEGCQNYAEYAYEQVYNRDYTTEDAKKLYAAVKKYFVPILPTILNNAAKLTEYELLHMPDVSEDAIVNAVGKNISKIDPELAEAYDYMCRYHLYDLKQSPTKMAVGYTDYLYEYNEPIIFICPDNTYYDYETLIHEFGHYNNAFHNSKVSFVDPINMDVAEIHSQGLELLYFPYADDLYKGMGDSARLLNLYNIASSVIEGCLYDEFQTIAYSSDQEYSVAELNDLFYRLAIEYGYSEEFAQTRKYSWVDVSHTFQSPMYYISYATSALSALDIFCSSLDNRQEAVDRYMELTTYGLDVSYCELIKTVGLRDIFEEETIRDIAADTVNYSRDIVKHDASVKSYRFIAKTMLVLVLIAIVIAAIVILVEKWLKKKSDPEDELRNEPTDNIQP